MAQFVPEEDEFRPILIDQAVAVDGLHKALPRHEAMIIIAEYPQWHERFAGLEPATRAERARLDQADYWNVSNPRPVQAVPGLLQRQGAT